jgi:hypothetical protein
MCVVMKREQERVYYLSHREQRRAIERGVRARKRAK